MNTAGPDPRLAERDRALAEWAGGRRLDLDDLSDAQRWVVFASLRFLVFAGPVPPLRRFVGYMLAHCDMDLSAPVAAAVVGQTDRAIRKSRRFKPTQFWQRLQEARRGHPQPKLLSEHVGPIAKFLAENKKCTVAELLGFISEKLGIDIDRLTLRRFLKRYGLGCLRENSVSDAPFLPDVPSTAVPSP
jgi:hypothetical protein